MSDRNRLSWQSGKQPVLPVERKASAHPAYPDEGAAHPAAYPDPEQPDAYENGDTSSWAEDPTKGPYPNSAHPQTPDEGPAHPAAAGKKEMPTSVGGDQITNEDLGVSKAAAAQLRIAVEKKAAKCIRVAQDLLSPWTEDAEAIEDQALDLMDIPDDALDSTLARLALLKNAEDEKPEEEEVEEEKTSKKKAKAQDEDEDEEAEEPKTSKKKAQDEKDEEPEEEDEEAKKEARLLRKMLAEEGMEPEDEDEDKTEKTACEDRMSALESQLASLRAMIEQKGQEPAPVDEDEALLASMLAEEEAPAAPAPKDEDAEIEAILKGMLAEEEKPVEPEAPAKAPVEDSDQVGADLSTVDDPMGLMDDAEMGEGEEALLANLFASDRLAAKKGDDDEEEEEEAEEPEETDEEPEEEPEESEKESKKKATKTASQKPQAKKASQGATRLGPVSRQDVGDISELEKLWPSAPDVSKVFGS
jgi:hypothetical protein